MKKISVIFSFIVLLFSCGNENKKESLEKIGTEVETVIPVKQYPLAISKVFNAHGGLDQWQAMNNLCFTMDNKGSQEIHTIDLKSRHEKIEHKDWSIGSDSQGVWVLENQPEAYKGNALFYKNLLFYFYAMPFVVADNGVVYTELKSTLLEGSTYNAIKLSFENGVGYSSTDEYIIYSDVVTNKMTWLAYTVTGNSGKKSDQWSYIKYADWQEVNGLQLPKKLTWYTVKDNKPVSPKNDRTFSNVAMTDTILDVGVFKKPETATSIKQ